MTDTSAALTCPKCGADMRSYERNGVSIDQCTGCRGIFLDRGELERLIDAESSYYQPPAAQPAPGNPTGYPQRFHGEDKHGGDYRRGDKRRRGGFLGELFD